MMMKENTFDKHFDNPDLQLTILLDDDLIIGEFRNQNKNLMEFLSIEEMTELVRYITEMPADDSNSKRAFRYPFYSCELLCCEIPKVADAFFGEDKKLLILLFQFLTQPSEINAVLAGYVCKVLFALSKLRSEVFYAELFSYPDMIPGLLRQLQSRSISEVIIKLLTIEKDISEDYTIQRVQLLRGVLCEIDQKQNFEVTTNIASIISEVLQRAYLLSSAQQLLDVLYKEQIEKLCQTVVSSDNFVSLSAGVTIYNMFTLVYKNSIKLHDPEDNALLNIEVEELFLHIENALPQWLKFLQESDSSLLGQHKLKIVEIIGVALTLNQESFIVKLDELDIFSVYNQLFVKYERHDIFHLSYYRFIVHIIEQKIDSLVKNLFEKNQFVNFLLSCTSDVLNSKSQRKGYLGFLTKLAHFLEEFAPKYSLIRASIDTQTWKEFKVQYFDKAEKTNNIELGGHTRYEGNEDPECHFNRDDIEKKYSNFLSADHNEQEKETENLFDTFNISDQNQQQQCQDSNLEEIGQWDFSQQNNTKVEEHQIAHEEKQENYWAKEEKLDEYNRFWRLQPQENSSYHNDALYEFEKSL